MNDPDNKTLKESLHCYPPNATYVCFLFIAIGTIYLNY